MLQIKGKLPLNKTNLFKIVFKFINTLEFLHVFIISTFVQISLTSNFIDLDLFSYIFRICWEKVKLYLLYLKNGLKFTMKKEIDHYIQSGEP